MRTEATEIIRQRLCITVEQLYQLQFDCAMYYLNTMFPGDEATAAYVSKHKAFWAFWLEQWKVIDSVIYHKQLNYDTYKQQHSHVWALRNDEVFFQFENNYDLLIRRISYEFRNQQDETARADQGISFENCRARIAGV